MGECDLQKDRAWDRQWYCGIHCVWFRDDDPSACPVGEAVAEAVARERDEIVAAMTEFANRYQELEGEAVSLWDRRMWNVRLVETRNWREFIHARGTGKEPGDS